MARGKLNTSLVHKLRIEVHAAWLAARSPQATWYARLFGILITAYALSPIDLIPDFIPVLGLVDDAILIPVGLWLFMKMLPAGLMDQCRAEAELASERPRSTTGAIIVVLIWLGAAALLFWLLAWNYS